MSWTMANLNKSSVIQEEESFLNSEVFFTTSEEVIFHQDNIHSHSALRQDKTIPLHLWYLLFELG
jgi:hypothetical protein